MLPVNLELMMQVVFIYTCICLKSVAGSCSLRHDCKLMKGLIARVIVG